MPPVLHLITPEYPPQPGGVGDYSKLLAERLAAAGEEIHVWCPPPVSPAQEHGAIFVHGLLGRARPEDLRNVGKQLDSFPGPRRLLVQWVPHGYGYRAMNLPFCVWLWKRSRSSGDRVEIMVHEPFLSFGEGSWRQNVAALIQRLMTLILLRAAERVWVSIPTWAQWLRPYMLGRRTPCQWLPVPSNVPVRNDLQAVQKVRQRYAPGETLLIGHFGTFSPLIAGLLEPILLTMKPTLAGKTILLLGMGSEEFRAKAVGREKGFETHIRATGALTAEQLSAHIAACDLLIQPYPDGVSTRRTSFMAGLSHGKPIVTTCGSLTEPLWEISEAVDLARVGDTAAFVRLVEQLGADRARRDRMSAAARKLYLERFDISHTVTALQPAAGQSFQRTNSDVQAVPQSGLP